MEMSPSELIAHLNAIRVGDLEAIRGKIREVSEVCSRIDQPDLAKLLDEAVGALDEADVRTYRKRIETVVARLGHLR